MRVKAKEIITVRLRYKLDEFGLIPKLLMTCNPAKNWVYSEFYKLAQNGTLEEWKRRVEGLCSGSTDRQPSPPCGQY